MTRSLAVASLLVLVAGAVAAQGVNVPFSHTLRPRGVAEECFRLAGGESVVYAFESSALVDFNVHFHRGNDVEYPVRRDQVARANERFTAPSAEEYCLMWTNRTTAPVAVKGALLR